MTFFSILSLISRLVGLVRLGDFFWEKHEAKLKAQNLADAPTTRQELEKTLDDGKL
jgi:hypothetical protein